jgi:hypothetical protein
VVVELLHAAAAPTPVTKTVRTNHRIAFIDMLPSDRARRALK